VSSETPSGGDASGSRLDSDAVIHGRCNPLGAAEITLGRLHGKLPKKKLNLLQFAACGGKGERNFGGDRAALVC
jgi:hypothetical protein